MTNSRTWSVIDDKYKQIAYYYGFNKTFSKPHTLVLTDNEGSLEVWALDVGIGLYGTEKIMKEFQEYLTKYEPWTRIVGTYKETGFHGFTCPKELVSNVSRF